MQINSQRDKNKERRKRRKITIKRTKESLDMALSSYFLIATSLALMLALFDIDLT